MCTTMVSMRMLSQLIPTVCGGIGDLTIHGDGVRRGITADGMGRISGMAVIGEDGIRIITIITGIRDITITRIMHGEV